MKTKQIPAIITLIAGLITCIISFLNHTSIEDFVKILCLVLVVFFVLGSVVKYIIDRNFKPVEEKTEEEDQQTEGSEQEEKEGTDSKEEE